MVQLLTDPGAFANSEVRVRGFLAAPTNLALFLTREHAEKRDAVPSVPVADSTPDGHLILKCAAHHAIIDGTFRKQSDAPLIVGDSGISLQYIIADVERVMIYRGVKLEQCWPVGEGGSPAAQQGLAADAFRPAARLAEPYWLLTTNAKPQPSGLVACYAFLSAA